MPECTLGRECVNPHHLGTGADFVLALKGRRRKITPEPRKMATIELTLHDRRFLEELRIRW
jgi:hypothetical protein